MKRIKKAAAWVFVFCAIGLAFFFYLRPGNYDPYAAGALGSAAYFNALERIKSSLSAHEYDYIDYLKDREHEDKNTPAAGLFIVYEEKPEQAEILLYEQSMDIKASVPASGFYTVYLTYLIPGDAMLPAAASLFINNKLPFKESRSLSLPLRFMDADKNYTYDRYGDEVLPTQLRLEEWFEIPLYDNRYATVEPLHYYLEKGENLFTIENTSRTPLMISRLRLAPVVKIPSHEEYMRKIQAEYGVSYENNIAYMFDAGANEYSQKVSADFDIGSWHDPSFSRYDDSIRRINFAFWYIPGTEIMYEIQVPEDGFYVIGLHYMNYQLENSCFHSIKINGEIPFKEFAAVEFPATGLSLGNKVVTGSDGEPLKVFLTGGSHTLSLKSEIGPLGQTVYDLQKLLLHISEFTLDVKKIAGNDIDSNRTWQLTRYLPVTVDYLQAYQIIINEAARNIAPYTRSGMNSESVAYLLDAAAQLDLLLKYPDELPLRLPVLSGESGSVADYIAYAVESIFYQYIALDRVHVFSNDEMPPANVNLLKKTRAAAAQVVLSYTSDKYQVKNDPGAVNIWIHTSQVHINALQKLVDGDFSRNTGMDVKLSLMPDPSKLILANASGETPDAAIGINIASSGAVSPFDLASRGVLYDMTNQPDFWDTASRFAPGSLVSYIFNEGMYAIPETISFYALAYRTDVFNKLGLKPPDTWQDVVDMLPVLQRFGMDFYHPVATADAYKYFYQTTPFIYQNGGTLFSADGLTARVNEPEAVAGIRFLGALFSKYALPAQVPSFFNSFRNSITPIGIIDPDTYNLLRIAAPELTGLWELAPYPGTMDGNGNVNRWYVANSSACVIFKNSPHRENAWEFLKWWTSAPTQAAYSKTMQMTFGGTYLWMTSNLEALRQTPIDPAHLYVIMDQIDWMRSTPFTPGYYQLERSLSNIWNSIVFDGMPPQVAVDQNMLTVSREQVRKMTELGFCDGEGNLIRPYAVREIDWVMDKINKR